MVTVKPAAELVPGDVFSSDGYAVDSVELLGDGRVSVWSVLEGRSPRGALLEPDFPCQVVAEEPVASPDGYAVDFAGPVLEVVAEPDPEQLATALDRVKAAVAGLTGAEDEYRAALLAALSAGASYVRVARAAGKSRQAVREFALRSVAVERKVV